MARSRSLSLDREARERSRKRDRSPREHKKDKKSKKSHSRRSRSKSPKREHKKRRHSSPNKDERRPTKEKALDVQEEGELVADASKAHANGVKEVEPEKRSQAKDRHRSKSRERHRSRSRERQRSKSRDRRRSASRDRKRPDSKERHRSGSPSKDRADAPPAERNGTVNGHKSAEPADKLSKTEPLSLEEFLKKKKEEEDALTKPKFLSKKDREALALQRLKEQADSKKQRVSESAGRHDPFRSNGDRHREEKRREAERKREEEKRLLEEERERDKQDRERQKELELIKQQYLGTEKQKRKIRKPSEKFHLNFDWEAGDDTSKDLNPIYNSTHEAALLFGSGRRAGVDVQEQKKTSVEHQRQLLRKLRESQGLKETEMDRKREDARKRQALQYDATNNKNSFKEHWSTKARDEMTERDWRIFREDFNISYKGVHVVGAALPYRNWEEAHLPKVLMDAIKDLGYKKPSPIQMASIPLGLMQRDVIGVAETGSGKTASFVLPMLCYIMKLPKMTDEIAAQGPYAVIMAPVRELAQQIEEETIKLAKHTSFRTVSVVGGQDISEQAFKLRKGCEIVIATPGRLKDCLDQSYAVLNQCNYVVLDEADRMIDMGFEPQVVAVLDAMPSSNLKPESEEGVLEENKVYRTTYMFSATMPPPVERLARKYMRRPAVINIGSAGKATDNVTQEVKMVKDNEKPNLLEQELSAASEKRTIVFVNTKKSCDTVSRYLDNWGYSCTVLHGGKTQDQRELSLAGFREEKYNVLVATDVAGRGIDVPDVGLVINYDMPLAIDQYTHRIGRTARAGKKGVAATFLTPNDTEIYYDLKKFLEDSGAKIPHQLAHHEAARNKPSADKSRRETVVYTN